MADAAADVKRFDEQLVQVERAWRIAGRERDERHLSVPSGAVPRQFPFLRHLARHARVVVRTLGLRLKSRPNRGVR